MFTTHKVAAAFLDVSSVPLWFGKHAYIVHAMLPSISRATYEPHNMPINNTCTLTGMGTANIHIDVVNTARELGEEHFTITCICDPKLIINGKVQYEGHNGIFMAVNLYCIPKIMVMSYEDEAAIRLLELITVYDTMRNGKNDVVTQTFRVSKIYHNVCTACERLGRLEGSRLCQEAKSFHPTSSIGKRKADFEASRAANPYARNRVRRM